MKHKITLRYLFLLFLVSPLGGPAQPLGKAVVPEGVLKATVLIERMMTNETTQFVPPTNILAVLEMQGTNRVAVAPTNLFRQVSVIETNYFPLGSGVLVIKDTKEQHVFIVTAGHVIPPDGDVFFRVATKNGSDAKHYSSKLASQLTGLAWVRSTNADLAIGPICFNQEEDDIQVMVLSDHAATYGQVAIGDEVFVAGYPSSVASVSDAGVHIIRNGVVASKSGNGMLLIDAFTFPGNSGGPVFWKPSMGFDVAGFSPKIPARGPNLVGIVLAYHPYREQAISAVTGRERIIFESNSGLTDVVSASRILEFLVYPQVQEALARWNRAK